MNKKLLNILIKDLEHDIDNYIGNYGTIDERLNYTLTKILNILKVMNGEVPFEKWYLDEILGDKEYEFMD